MPKYRPLTDQDHELIAPYYVPRPKGVIPSTEIDDTPAYCFKVNQDWLSHVLGVLFALTEHDAWLGTSQEVEFARSEIRRLISSIAPCEEATMPSFVGQLVFGWWGSCPENTLPLNGGLYEKAEYPDLWEHLDALPGNNFEVDSLYFMLPNAGGYNLTATGEYWTNPFDEGTKIHYNFVNGSYGGERIHTLTTGELPIHNPLGSIAATTPGGGSVESIAVRGGAGVAVYPGGYAIGGGQAHNNMPPHLNARLCIVFKDVNSVSNSIRFRQNPSNPCQLQQSFNNGISWSLAFDYSLCGSGEPETTLTDILAAIQALQDLLELYNGDVTNISDDLVYGDSDDGIRDNALCFAVGLYLDALYSSLRNAAEKSNSGQNPTWQQQTSWALEATALGVGAVAALTPGLNLAVLGTIGLGAAFGALGFDIWDAYISSEEPPVFEDYDLSNWQCCITGELSGSTISQASFALALQTCLVPADLPGREIIELAIQNISLDEKQFVAFLKLLADVTTSALDGVELPCPCDPENCIEIDFESELDPDPVVVHPSSEFVNGVGIRSLDVGGVAAGRLYWSSPVVVTSIEIEWRRPKNVPPGSGGNNCTIIDISNGGYVSIGNTGSTGTAGRVTTVFDTSRAMDALQFTAIGSNPSNANLKGLIYRLKVCWQGSGVPT